MFCCCTQHICCWTFPLFVTAPFLQWLKNDRFLWIYISILVIFAILKPHPGQNTNIWNASKSWILRQFSCCELPDFWVLNVHHTLHAGTGCLAEIYRDVYDFTPFVFNFKSSKTFLLHRFTFYIIIRFTFNMPGHFRLTTL